ncbi:hypothetical protein TRFO_23787 [Tritrichomonas foetus]|uniref:Uncharacterized protein n=1 Tax=Tritrichomonas foetus TaxID=1144522 RepID=A0A1J4K9E1_9EUKA|nr:hypothetical protein TRFO_23787 [Tritrichomonas foetus]|eukprot:OHT07843.1 hypothetical protein TRFO_23787 [Tritrichomonas foetus]
MTWHTSKLIHSHLIHARVAHHLWRHHRRNSISEAGHLLLHLLLHLRHHLRHLVLSTLELEKRIVRLLRIRFRVKFLLRCSINGRHIFQFNRKNRTFLNFYRI